MSIHGGQLFVAGGLCQTLLEDTVFLAPPCAPALCTTIDGRASQSIPEQEYRRSRNNLKQNCTIERTDLEQD